MSNKEPIAVAADANAAGQNLRRRAEDKIKENIANAPQMMENLSADAAALMLHELRVHQFELEMQNDEMQRTQERLESSYSRYFDIYNFAPVSYLTLSEAGLILEANITMATELGMNRESLINQPFIRFILPADQDSYYLHLKQLVKTGVSKAFEFRMVKPDGGPFWVRIEETLMSNENDETLCHAVLIDITELKQALAALHSSQIRLRALLEHSFEALALVDSTTQEVVEVNPQFAELLGYSLPEDAPLYVQQFIVEAEDQQQAKALIYRHKNGAEVPVEHAGTVISIDGKDYLLARMRDRTRERRRYPATAAFTVT